jgi:Cupin
MDRIGPASEDGLSGVLREVNVRSAVYCLSDFSAPWGFRVENSPVAKFHVLLQGAAWLSIGGREPVSLRTGDLVLLPHGEGHIIADQPGSVVQHLDAILAEHPVDSAGRLAYGGDGAPTRLLCGGFELLTALPDELADVLPPVLVLDAGTGLARWLEPLFAPAQGGNPGEQPGRISDLRETGRCVPDPGAAQLSRRGRQQAQARPGSQRRSRHRPGSQTDPRPARGTVDHRLPGPGRRDVADLLQLQIPRSNR